MSRQLDNHGNWVSVFASRASVRRAQAAVKRAERAALTAERRTLLRGAGNVRRMEIAMLRGRKTKAGPKVAPLDKPWRAILHPDAKMGGVLATKELWRIGALSRSAREVDIVDGLQPLLARWEAGGDTRPAMLRPRVADWRSNPGFYHRELAGKGGYPAHLSAVPPVMTMPRRDIRTPVSAYADRHLPRWYQEIYSKIVTRGA